MQSGKFDYRETRGRLQIKGKIKGGLLTEQRDVLVGECGEEWLGRKEFKGAEKVG